MVTTFYQTRSFQRTRNAFRERFPECFPERFPECFPERFPERKPPAAQTIWENVRKYQEHGTSLNRNKGNSGRKRTGRSEENIAAVRLGIPAQGEMGWDCLRHNRITRLDLYHHPYQIHIRHQLTPGDFARRLAFAKLVRAIY